MYDLGDQDVKDSLVRGLVGNLTEGRKAQAQSVTADTQLFASSIGTTPDGSKISTYQSVLSLAADMNQPDLVYKFMSLASHHQIWNSRRGASMGFSSIARQAEAELLPHLPKIVPRLYRFRFDPNPKIAESMKNIWRTLVQNPTQTVNSCFDAILCEILKGMTEDAWRTRESSCSALADLLPGRLIEELEPYMTQLWSVSFRAFDDIKDSVRKAALSSCKTLTSITLRNCSDTCSNKTLSGRLVGTMVPFLLNSGLGSMSEDVRNLSLGTILKLCKQGGALLKPHITDIVYSLLEALSSIEPQMMNYLSFHTDKYNITQEQLDMSRLSAAKSSPILEAVECTIAHIDADILSQLVPKLCHLVRKGVGLPTRAGCARFIYYLTSRCPNDLKPHADTILKALSHAIHDRSIVVRKSYSVAVGHVAKLCSEGALETLMSHLKVSYLEAEDENEKSVAGITMLEMTRHSPETMKDFHNVLLPLAFMGLSDVSDASMAKVWQAVWDENTAGSTTAIKMWAKELIDECEAVLQNSPSWTLKKQVGKCMTEIAKANGSNNNITARCFELLKGSLTGRTWDGKEAILEAYAMTVVEGKEYFLSNPSEQQIVEDVVIREALKKNKAYRRVALQYLGDVFEALSSNRFEEVEAYLLECACDSTIDDMDVDEDRQKPMMLAIQSNAFKAIGKCFPKESHLQAEMCSRIQFKLCSSLIGNPWNVRISVIEAMEKIFSKLDDRAQDAVFQRQLVDRVFEALLECIQDQKYSSLREKSVSCMSTMLEQFMKTALFSGYKARIYDALALLANKETGSVQHGLKQLMTSIQLYKGKV